MAKIIRDESIIHAGGIIFLGGFCHTELINQLKLIDPKTLYRYAIFTDSNEDRCMTSGAFVDPDIKHWINFSQKKFRDQFYGINVHFFDMAKAPSFELIQSICQLTEDKPCEEISMLGRYFDATIGQPFTYTMDKQCVLTASTLLSNEKEIKNTTDILSVSV